VKRQAEGARFVTSVCTGALVLGAAGLLGGKRATTHWASHHLLASLAAIPVNARVVGDGNLMTGGGVTAGIDFALTQAVAEAIALNLEYAPAPPFDAGSPDTAPADVVEASRKRMAPSSRNAVGSPRRRRRVWESAVDDMGRAAHGNVKSGLGFASRLDERLERFLRRDGQTAGLPLTEHRDRRLRARQIVTRRSVRPSSPIEAKHAQ
jgi:hypothetical protein